jgi:hypothetical protein
MLLENLQIEMIFVITKKGEEQHGWGPKGSKVTIKAIKIDDPGNILIGVHFETSYREKYHDLDGTVKHGHGYWLTPSQLLSDASFTLIQENVILQSGIKLKERDIGNKQGRILKHFSNAEYIMVELLENVEGCSGDGLGKAGHCVVLKKDKINFKKNEYKKKENKS